MAVSTDADLRNASRDAIHRGWIGAAAKGDETRQPPPAEPRENSASDLPTLDTWVGRAGRERKRDRLDVVPASEQHRVSLVRPRPASKELLKFIGETETDLRRLYDAIGLKNPAPPPSRNPGAEANDASGISQTLREIHNIRQTVDAETKKLRGHAELLKSVCARVAQIAGKALNDICGAVGELNEALSAYHYCYLRTDPQMEDRLSTQLRDTLHAVETIVKKASANQKQLATEVANITGEAADVADRVDRNRPGTTNPDLRNGTSTADGEAGLYNGNERKQITERLPPGEDPAGEPGDSETEQPNNSLAEMLARTLQRLENPDVQPREFQPTLPAQPAAPQRKTLGESMLEMLPILAMVGATAASSIPGIATAASVMGQQEQARHEREERAREDEREDDEEQERREVASAKNQPQPDGAIQPPPPPGSPPGDQPQNVVNLGGTLVTAPSPEAQTALQSAFTSPNPDLNAYAENSQPIDPAQVQTGDVVERREGGYVPVAMLPDGPKVVMHNQLRPVSELGDGFLGFRRPQVAEVAAAPPPAPTAA